MGTGYYGCWCCCNLRVVEMNPPAFWPHIKYFKSQEFYCKCGKCQNMEHMTKDTMLRLDILREKVGRPMIISSGWRCESHPVEANKTKPGVHTTGHAVDVLCSGELSWAILRHAPETGFVRIGVSQKGNHGSRFLHLDDYVGSEFIRPTVWSY